MFLLLSSHIFREIDATCDKISIIKDGRLISTFIANDLRHNQEKTFEIEFIGKDLLRFKNEASSFKKVNIISLDSKKNQVKVCVNDADINDFIAFISEYNLKFFSEIKFLSSFALVIY